MPDPAFPFHFLRPVWLWLLVPAFVVAALARRAADPSKRWGAIITPPLLEKLLIRRKSKWRFRPIHGLIIALVLGALGIAGPTWHREKPPFTEDKAPLVIALDLSRDMDAIDVQPTRLERAKLKILDLMKARQGARTALFVYASSAHMVLPLTSDESLVALYAESLSTDLLSSGPRDTVSALRSIDYFLRNETIPGTILFITPGIERRAFPAFEQHRDTAQNQVLVLAIGTPAGGPIRTASGQFASDAGRRIFSKLDVAGLRALKQQAGVPVGTVTLNDDDVKWVQRHAQNHLQAMQEHGAQLRWVDAGYWLTIPVALAACLWFRKGWTVAALLLFLTFHLPVQAQDRDKFHFIDLWMNHDQQGRYFYQKGDFATAAKRFDDPMWKGVALARSGDYATALDQFALLDTPESWFNQGNALAHLKRYPEAIHAYQQALRARPHWKDAEDNLALVRSLLPPKKKDEEEEEAPDVKPDKMQFDEKGKKGKKTRMTFGPEQAAEVWMRNIQVSPADFLRRKFAMESAAGAKRQ